ncbi:uncharacterized protein PgNI_03003 [Pyricularia grisea]|uniref:Uncharacterized protein n=1 Tax=Pyricularia grisea TaxID=148305 RepID=A0A6P8BCA1_PYRGI|nr:uncharacterized protein PgNI_03003 [Pyricularia grisea]TLD13428.1 hypothetical protein PgNI_03003 [Pyricularia grisea]
MVACSSDRPPLTIVPDRVAVIQESIRRMGNPGEAGGSGPARVALEFCGFIPRWWRDRAPSSGSRCSASYKGCLPGTGGRGTRTSRRSPRPACSARAIRSRTRSPCACIASSPAAWGSRGTRSCCSLPCLPFVACRRR